MNSSDLESQTSTPEPTSNVSSDALPVSATDAPLLSLNPRVKPLKEMSPEELQAWHARHRAAIFSTQTLLAEARERKATERKEKRVVETQATDTQYE